MSFLGHSRLTESERRSGQGEPGAELVLRSRPPLGRRHELGGGAERGGGGRGLEGEPGEASMGRITWR